MWKSLRPLIELEQNVNLYLSGEVEAIAKPLIELEQNVNKTEKATN